jgi:hypothetical protein
MNTYNLNLENKEGGKNIIKHIISKEQIWHLIKR